MECYYHEGIAANGICKSCQRGICKNCTTEISNGIACKGKCEDQAIELENLIASNMKLQKPSEQLLKSVSIGSGEIFHLILGLIFIGFGVYSKSMFSTIIGSAFLLFGTFGVYKMYVAKRDSSV